MKSVFPIRGCVKNYDWGKIGLNSMVAQLQKSSFNDFEVVNDMPYAELWLGTHDSGPSTLSENNFNLKQWISSNPASLGQNIKSLFGETNGLPFLFKVLSVNKALSIQAHPNKETAEILHKKFKDRYPDDNHKPEMAIALSEFEALCGFRPLEEIKTFLKELPQLGAVVKSKMSDNGNKNELKQIFTELMTSPGDIFKQQLFDLIEYFRAGKSENELCSSVSDLFLRICLQYPGDIGCFCIFFLNYLKLKPGEAIFLAANEPHAYLFGDCVECMACSDNVVRAGLTPKFKDVQTLCDILSYSCKSKDENIFKYVRDPSDRFVKIYNPPVKEFVVDQITVPGEQKTYELKKLDSASILLVIQGNASYESDENKHIPLVAGTALFISSQSHLKLDVVSSLLMFRAYCSE